MPTKPLKINLLGVEDIIIKTVIYSLKQNKKKIKKINYSLSYLYKSFILSSSSGIGIPCSAASASRRSLVSIALNIRVKLCLPIVFFYKKNYSKQKNEKKCKRKFYLMYTNDGKLALSNKTHPHPILTP